MALEWIKSYKKLERDPKALHFRALMDWSMNEAIGFLHRFWWWADDVASDGVVTSLCLPGVVGGALGVGSSVGDKAVEKMKEAGLLDVLDSGETVIHNVEKYRGTSPEKREADKVRKRRSRMSQPCHADVTRDKAVTDDASQAVTLLDEDEEEDKETTYVCESGESSTGVFEGQFDPRRPGILDSWKERRRMAGLDTAITQRDKTTASSVLLAVDAGDYALEQFLAAMDNLMADPEWRHRYSFHGFVNDLDRWLNRKKEDDNPNPGGRPSRADSGKAKAGKPKYSDIVTGESL